MEARALPPVEATALLVDLRSFTPSLNAAPIDRDGTNTFCHVLARFYRDCLAACRLALPPARRATPLHVSSTGDGAVFVFTGARHFAHGFLAAIVLDATLTRTCREYNAARPAGAPAIGYGIGVESGQVSRVSAEAGAVIDTYIGHCINVAARAEAISKTLFQANTIIADHTVEQVGEALFGRRMQPLRDREARCADDAERLRIHDEMNDLNHDLCVSYINRHVLRGVEAPLPLYRLARTALRPGVARFDRLVGALTEGDPAHLAEIVDRFEPTPVESDRVEA